MIKFKKYYSKPKLIDIYQDLFYKGIEKLNTKFEYQLLGYQINVFSRTLMHRTSKWSIPASASNIDDYVFSIIEREAMVYELANKIAYRNYGSIPDNYDTIYNFAYTKLQNSLEYKELNYIISCNFNYLLKYTDSNKILLVWLEDAICKRVAMEYNYTNKLALYLFKKKC